VKTLTHSQLVSLISSIRGAAPIGLETVTEAKVRKTGNPFKGIYKECRVVGWVGVRYGDSVNREMTRQGIDGKFEVEPRPWGQWLVPNKIAEHKGNLYLRTQSTPGTRKRQPAKVLRYRDETGRFLAREEIAPFLVEASASKKQAEAGLIDKSDQIMVREYKFDSIKKIRVGGKTYSLVK
jgi:hypothetical protein